MKKVIYAVNSMLLLLIVYYEYNSGSDKSAVLSYFGFIILVVLNVVLGFLAQLDKKPIYKHYYNAALGLIVVAVLIIVILSLRPEVQEFLNKLTVA